MLYIVTAVHNRYEITEKFVKQLTSQTYKKFALVLVDDGCTDGTVNMVKSYLPTTVILRGDGNLYWGGALHMAYKWLRNNAADGDYVMFANDDTQFGESYIETAMSHFSDSKDCFMLTGCGYELETGEYLDGAIDYDYSINEDRILLQPGKIGKYASTRSLFLPVEILKKTGGFHPVLLPHYGSDYEWTMRANRKGFEVRSFSNVSYKFSSKTTGDNCVEKLTLKKLFSKRSQQNPFYKIVEISMITPKRYLPRMLFEQMKRYIGKTQEFKRIIDNTSDVGGTQKL